MIITVNVKPHTSRLLLTKLAEHRYEATLTEPAEDNRANIQLLNLLARELQVPARSLRIKNPRSRLKRIELI